MQETILELFLTITKTGQYEGLSFYNMVTKWSDNDDWIDFGSKQPDGSYLIKGLTASDFLLKVSDLAEVCSIDKITFDIRKDDELKSKLQSLYQQGTNKAKVLRSISDKVTEAIRLKSLFFGNVEIVIAE